jgi:pre-mRNA-splicing factor SYF2
MTVRDAARLERQRKLAEVLRTQAEAEDRGEDVERQKNWEWTIEENDNWEKKKARKARRADYEFHGAEFLVFLASCHSGSSHV